MTIRPHWINAFSRSDRPEVIHYDDSPWYEEWQAREEAFAGNGAGSWGVTYYYSHTLCVRPGAHGKPIVEYVEFDVRERPAPQPDRHTYSWTGSVK